ncbi:hypothetical protein Leryth_021562 [Lithospermum erythrorhizon]|nr:hypothetical protein Leryth_021562 [Lithospermum erythrorhizon]
MGRSESPEKMGLNKGSWTAEEDQKLLAFIEEHGHGSWRTLPAKAGLRRCGKSCRLRWSNYLRPDIKRGKFSLQEEQTIIQLHALLGNRWSAIATHLPKRTDNEIKNCWNTHLRKRLTKMGIDPVTHKPKNIAQGSPRQLKDASNLSHMAQWESARLEAEARHGRESKLVVLSTPYQSNQLGLVSDFTHHQVPNSTTTSKIPPCLDVLKARQITRPHANSSLLNSFFTSTSTTLESPTSTLNFSNNMFNVPNSIVFNQNSMIGDVGISKGGDVQNNWKDGANQEMAHQEVSFPNDNMDNFIDGFVPQIDHEEVDGDLEENKNYWHTILNLVTLQSNSPVIYNNYNNELGS